MIIESIVAYLESALLDELMRLLQQIQTVRTFVLWVTGREMHADVAESGGA